MFTLTFLLLEVVLGVSIGEHGPQRKEVVVQIYKWPLGGNGSVDVNSENLCQAFKPLEGMFLSIDDAPDLNSNHVQFVPAPGAVVDSCAVSSNLKDPVVLGEYDGSCISDPLFCTTGSFTWAVWLKIHTHSQQHVMDLANLISAGNYDSFKSGFNLWLFRGDLLLCTANNNKQRSIIGVNMTDLVHEEDTQQGQWFHLVCSFNFSNHGVVAMMYFNGIMIQQAENNPTPNWDGFLDMQIQYNIEDNHIDNYLKLGKYFPTFSSNGTGWQDDDFEVSYSNLMVTDGILGPDTIQHLYLCGSMDKDLKLRSLVWVTKEIDPFTLQLVCKASAATGPSITWTVHKSKLDSGENIEHDIDNGVRIENRKESSCVLTSILTVENYRKRGYTESTVVCSTSTPESGLHQSANVSVPGEPEYFQWPLGENGNVDVSSEDRCHLEVFNRGTSGVWGGFGDAAPGMVPAPRLVEDFCAVRRRKKNRAFFINNVNGTCVTDQRYCTSAGFTWSVWLRLGLNIDGYPVIHSGSYNRLTSYQDHMFTFNLWVTFDRLLFCSAYNNAGTLARGINITDASFKDNWFHIACVFNFSTTEDGNFGFARAYINGIENEEQHDIDNYLYFHDYGFFFGDISEVVQYGESYVSLGTSYFYVGRTDYSNLAVIDGVLEDAEIQYLHSCGSRNWDLKLRSLVRVSEGISALSLQLVCTASDATGPSITWRVLKSKHEMWEDVSEDEVNAVRIESHSLSSCVLTSTLTVSNYRKLGYVGSAVMCVAATPRRASNQSSTFRVPEQSEVFQWSLGDNGTVDVKSEDLCSLAALNGYGQQANPFMVTAPQVVEDSCAVSLERYSHVDIGDMSSTCVADYSFCVSAGFTWSVWLNADNSLIDADHAALIVSSGSRDLERSTFNLWATEGFKHLFCAANINNNTIVRGIKLSDVILKKWFHIACVFNLSSTVDSGVVRSYIDATEYNGQYVDSLNYDFAQHLESNLTLGQSFDKLNHRRFALSNLVVTDGPIGDEKIRGLYECGSLDWDLKLRSLVRVSKGVNPLTLQIVCTASATTGPSIKWSFYKSKSKAWEDIKDTEETSIRIDDHAASSCVLTSTLTVDDYRKRGYTGSAFKCSTTTPSSVSGITANITIPDEPAMYKWSLGENVTVDLINGESCNTASFTDGTVTSYGSLVSSLIPAPQAVENSCAFFKHKYSSINLGEYDGSCVSDFRLCMSTSFTWSVWLMISYVRTYDRYPTSIISTGVDENSKFNFRLWLTSDLKYIVCTMYNKDTTTDSSNNTLYSISRSAIVPSFVQGGSCKDCPWFHVACSVNFTETEDTGKVDIYINGVWIVGSTDSFVDDLELFDGEVNSKLSGVTLGNINHFFISESALEIAFSNLVLKDGYLGDEDIGHLYSCGSMEWGIKLRSLVRVSNGVSPFTLQLQCTASASSGPFIKWSVYKSKRKVWDDVRDDEENGVRIENHDVSSCVLTSTLTIMNYRKLGFSGSVLKCSAYCSTNQAIESAKWTIEAQPELYQWRLGSNGTVKPKEYCDTAAFVDDRVVSLGGLNASLVPAPQVVEESCSVLSPVYSYIDLGSFKDTCVSDYRFCVSTGYTWSVWLKVEFFNSYYNPYGIVSTNYDMTTKSNFRIWITKDFKFMVCSASKTMTDSNNNSTSYRISKGFNITGLVRKGLRTDYPWFHVACVVNIDNDVIKSYVNGVLIDDGFYDDDDFQQSTTLNLHLGDNLGRIWPYIFEARIAFSNLLLVDGKLDDEGVRTLFSCGSIDWSLKVRSLNEVTKGVDHSHLRLVCTASASSGLDIAWRIYHSQCDAWESLQNGTDDRIVIEISTVSSCVQTSTLTILNYWDRLVSRSIVMCSASSPDKSDNQTASLVIKALSVIGKSTSQSTTHGTSYSPQMAIDGNQASFSHTVLGDPHPWWKLDLAGEHRLGQIIVQLRTGCCGGNRFLGATARAGLSSNYTFNQQCGQPATSSQTSFGATNVFLCDPPVVARWVSFDIDPSYQGVAEAVLQLAEVSVMEYTWERNKKTIKEDDSGVPFQEWSLKVQQLEQVLPHESKVDLKIQCKVNAIVDSFITWRVYRPICKAWENVSGNQTDAGIRIEEIETSSCIQMSTLTISNYRERGYEGSVIFCSAATPDNDASDSAHLMIPDNFGKITEDWTLSADLIHIPAATNSSDIQLQCTANAVSGPTIAWRVYRSKCGVWESFLQNKTKDGVNIEQRSLSPCVELSILTIMNYRERGYSGSVVVCSTSTPGNDNVRVNFTIPDNFGNITEDWTLKADLIHIPAATNSSDVQLQCTANAISGPTIAWRVYRSKCGVWESFLQNKTKDGVNIEQRSLSPCVELSILTIMNYRERGYSGSVLVCSTSTPGNDHVQVNYTIPDIKTNGQTEDWTLQLHSLERLAEYINQHDMHLSCTASAFTGPSIDWHVYFPLCRVSDTLHSSTELGIIVEDRAASPCLKTSTLTLLEYAERGYKDAVIKCIATATGSSTKLAKKLRVLDHQPTAHSISETPVTIHRLAQMSVGANDSNMYLLCASSITINPMIVWRVYQSRCGTWESFIIDTKEGVGIENMSLSACVQTSKLTIFNYLQEGYNGAVVECSVTDTLSSANYSANFTISENETAGDIARQQIQIVSLVEVTQGVNQSNKRLLCSAIGSSVEWRVYVSNLKPIVINDTDTGLLIERNMVSSCVFSSTLTILNYREHTFAGSVVMCTTSILGTTGNHSANITLPSVENVRDERVAEMNCTSLKLVQVHAAGAQESDGQFMCTVLGNANVSHSWQVSQSQCGYLHAVDIDTNTGINVESGNLSQYIQTSTLTMTNYFNEGSEWSVITCSTLDPWTRMNCSANLTTAVADEAKQKITLEGLSLTNVSEGLDPSDLRLMCSSSDVLNSVEFTWQVYQPACRMQKPLLSLPEAGVYIQLQELQVSPCVRSSTLDISDYRERGYGGSIILCKATSAENSSISYSANFTVQADLPEGGTLASNDGDLNVFNQLEVADHGRDICGATRIYEEEEKVVTVFVLKAEEDEYTNIDTEVENQVYSVKIPNIGSSDGSLVTVIVVYKSRGNFSGSKHSDGDSDKSLTFGSRIIEVTVFNRQGSQITEFSSANITITFPVQGMPGYEPICSFNSGKDNDWATDGCVVVNFNGYKDSNLNDNGNSSVNITCSCNHLTHFAVLLRLGEVEETYDTYVLDVLTKIGLAFSIVCLAVTLLAYTMLRLTSIRIVTHANLAFALMISDVIFFFIDTENVVGCTLVAILLHFFLLAAFTWMALEGAFLYIKVNPTFPWRVRLPIWLLIGWGVPFGVVVISAAVNFGGYGGNGRCWLSFSDGFVWAFLTPVIFIIAVNTCILIRLIVIFFSLKANKDKSEAKKLKAGLRLAVVLEPLLGLPWVLGLFYTGKETVVFAYAFVILNSFQGVFVFLGQCIFDQEVRNSFKSRSSKVESVSIPQDSTSVTLTSKQASAEPASASIKGMMSKSF